MLSACAARTWLEAASKVDCGRRWIAAQDFLLCRHAIGDSKHATRPVFVLLLLLMSAFGGKGTLQRPGELSANDPKR